MKKTPNMKPTTAPIPKSSLMSCPLYNTQRMDNVFCYEHRRTVITIDGHADIGRQVRVAHEKLFD